MIHLLFGDNDFLKKQQTDKLVQGFGGEVVRVDGEDLSSGELRNILQGQNLFATTQVVIITNLSQSSAWQDLPEIAEKFDGELILLEDKPDKRTKTYKWLAKHAKCQELVMFGEYEQAKVINWCLDWAKKHHGLEIDKKIATSLVERLGHDQMRLDKILEQLSLAERVDQALVDALVPLPKSESAFELLEATLTGRHDGIKKILTYLELNSGSEGVYMTVGLLTSQLIALSSLVLSGGDAEVAKKAGAHPFVVKKLIPLARDMTANDLRRLVENLSQADLRMKTTAVSPWLLLEAALVGSHRIGIRVNQG